MPDEPVRSVVWELVGREPFAETTAAADQIEATLPGGHLGLVSGQYRRARTFAPPVLGAFEFQGAVESTSLLAAPTAGEEAQQNHPAVRRSCRT